jgi:hypothetical protein
LVFDCDRCAAFPRERGKKRPDFIVCLQREKPHKPCWYIVEMKGRVSHPRQIVEQLQAGVNAIQTDRRFAVLSPSDDLVPVVLYYGKIRTGDFDKRYVLFSGRVLPVKPRRCGIELESLDING